MTPLRFVFVSDTHGDEIDTEVRDVFFEWLADFKPDVRIHGGDAFDMRCFRKKASDEEQRDGLAADIEAGCDFMRKFKPTHWLRGNHDERLWDVIASDDKKLSGYCGMLADQINESVGKKCATLPYDKRRGVLRLGATSFVHGYNAGIYAARQAALVYGDVVMGHIHRVDSHPIPGLDKRNGRSAGCLCKLGMSYNRAALGTLSQDHGWGFGVVNPHGPVTYVQAHKQSGKWVIPSEMKEYGSST